MSSNDRVFSMMMALGLVLTACGGELLAGNAEDLETENPGETAGGLADGVPPSDEELVEKGTGVLSGFPTSHDFGVLGFGESESVDWIIGSTRRSELVVALDVEPFTVDPIGCAVIEPTDPSLRRCVLRVTFSPPGEAGTYKATLTATDIDGNATSINVVGVGENFIF